MTGNGVTETSLRSKRFEFDVEIEDPHTGLTTTFPMEVDTGNPYAIALPRYFSEFFTEKRANLNLRGAGSANSEGYDATIVGIGELDIHYDTMAVMTLDNNYKYGLLGIGILKHLKTVIYDNPSDKKLSLEKTHI